jgi:tRNA pseudouridine38-40 synthase
VARYKSIVAYDGTEFQGFQRQTPDVATIQATLEEALRSIGWRGESLLAAGRTDAGVHARGQVIAFDLEWNHATIDLTAAINANLPDSVAVRGSQAVADDFHPRFGARRRTYRYCLYLAEHRDPLRYRYAWRRWPSPDLDAMNGVARWMVGRHDFGAFGKPPAVEGHTRRSVFRASWQATGDEATFEICGDAFLQHMVRKLVDACVAVGEGICEWDEVLELLDQSQRRWERGMAPAKGLVLDSVDYEVRD